MNTSKSKDFYNKPGFYIFVGTIVFSSLWAVFFLVFKNSIDLGEYKRQGQANTSQQDATAVAEEDQVQNAPAETIIAKEKDQSPNNKTEKEAEGGKAKLWIATEDLIAHGNKVYQAQCALCHGAKGLGDGTPGLIPPPRNLVEGKWTLGGSSKELFSTLQKGIEGTSMVSFKHLPKRDRWALVHYIRSITKNKVPDDEKELEEFAGEVF